MKKIINFSPLFWLILISSLLTQIFLPWWVIAVCSFIMAILVGKNDKNVFLEGFFAVFTLWLVTSAYWHFSSKGILSVKIAQILPTRGNVFALILLTAFIGGLVAGMAAWSGSLFKKILR